MISLIPNPTSKTKPRQPLPYRAESASSPQRTSEPAERLSPLARTEVMLPKSNPRECSQENENRLGIAWLRAAAFERHRSRLVPASRLVLTIKTGRGDPFRHRRSSPPAGKWAGFIGHNTPSQGLSITIRVALNSRQVPFYKGFPECRDDGKVEQSKQHDAHARH